MILEICRLRNYQRHKMHGLRKDKKFQLLLQLIMQSGGLGHFSGAFFKTEVDFLWFKVTPAAPVFSIVLVSI